MTPVPPLSSARTRSNALDRLTVDVAHEPLAGAESHGRAVVALASDPEVGKKSGSAFASRDLADEYGFQDVDGTLPRGPMYDRPRALREE